MNEKMTAFIEKLKTDKKTQVSTATAAIAVIAVLVTSITVPVVVRHNKKNQAKETLTEATEVKEVEQTLSSEMSAEIPATESVETQTEVENVSEPVSKYSVPTSTKATDKNNSNPQKGSNSKKPTQSSTQKPEQKPTQAPEQPQTPGKKQWTQDEVDAIVAEAKNYGISKGLSVNSNKGIQGSSWRNPAKTESPKEKIQSRLTYLIDQVYNFAIEDFGDATGSTFNVVTKKYIDSDGYTQWEIYVVY